jgi:hypothetical protein
MIGLNGLTNAISKGRQQSVAIAHSSPIFTSNDKAFGSCVSSSSKPQNLQNVLHDEIQSQNFDDEESQQRSPARAVFHGDQLLVSYSYHSF